MSVENVMKLLKGYVKGIDLNSCQTEAAKCADLEMCELERNVRDNNGNWNIKSEFLLRSNRPIIGKLITLCKRILRKSLRWYIDPIVQQQNTFNGSVTRSLNEIMNILIVINSRLKDQDKKTNELEYALTMVKSELKKIVNNELKEYFKRTNDMEYSIKKVNEEIHGINNRIEGYDKKTNDIEYLFKKVNEEIHDINNRIEEYDEKNKDIEYSLNEVYKEIHDIKDNIKAYNDSMNLLTCNSDQFERNYKDLIEQFANCKNIIDQLSNNMELSKNEINEYKSALDQLLNKILRETNTELQKQLLSSQNEIERVISNKLLQNNKAVENVLSEIAFLSGRIRRLEREKTGDSIDLVKIDSSIESSEIDNNDFDYFLFEHRFRGPENQIKENLRMFLDYYTNCNNVLDIGCGRGEFLELLRENGIKAKGIDINRDFIGHCNDKGLDVEYIDALNYLSQLEDNSLDGIFMSHVIEHINFSEMLKILDLCYIKLKKDSYIIISSPNPRSLSIFRNWFYVDPTHNKPFHPETLKFILGSVGFNSIEEKNYEYSKETYNLPLIEGGNISNISSFNEGISIINEILFGYQDYTVIARK